MIDTLNDREYEVFGSELGSRVLSDLVIENSPLAKAVINQRVSKATLSIPIASDWQDLLVMVDEDAMCKADQPKATIDRINGYVFSTDGLDEKGRVVCETLAEKPEVWVIYPEFLTKIGCIDADGAEKWGETA